VCEADGWAPTDYPRVLFSTVRFSVGDKLHGYTVKGVTAVQDFDLVAVQLTHDQTNAQHLHLARNDSNNAFGYVCLNSSTCTAQPMSVHVNLFCLFN